MTAEMNDAESQLRTAVENLQASRSREERDKRELNKAVALARTTMPIKEVADIVGVSPGRITQMVNEARGTARARSTVRKRKVKKAGAKAKTGVRK